MSDQTLKQATTKGLFWSSVERFSNQGVQFVFSIILARLLSPSDYGIIAMVAIFFAVAQSFVDSGFQCFSSKDGQSGRRFIDLFLFQYRSWDYCIHCTFFDSTIGCKFL